MHHLTQWAAEIDGAPVADAAGLTLLWELLHKRWPKQMSRRTLAGIKN